MSKIFNENINLIGVFKSEVSNENPDLDLCKSIIDSVDHDKLFQCFLLVRYTKHYNIIKMFMNKGLEADFDMVCMYSGYTELYSAVKYQQLNSVLSSIILGGNVNFSCERENDWTPLHLAANHNLYDIAKLLLENNADINIINNFGRTALDLAQKRKHKNIVKLLVEYGAK